MSRIAATVREMASMKYMQFCHARCNDAVLLETDREVFDQVQRREQIFAIAALRRGGMSTCFASELLRLDHSGVGI